MPWHASSGACETVLQHISLKKPVLTEEEGLDRTSHDACTCGRHNGSRRWRCAHEEAVDLDLGILNFMVEHLHATRQDLRCQDTVATTSVGFSNSGWRWHLATGSFFDAIFACVIYTLGRSLVAAKNLYLDLDKLLRRCYAGLHSALLYAGHLWTVCRRHCATR